MGEPRGLNLPSVKIRQEGAAHVCTGERTAVLGKRSLVRLDLFSSSHVYPSAMEPVSSESGLAGNKLNQIANLHPICFNIIAVKSLHLLSTVCYAHQVLIIAL